VRTAHRLLVRHRHRHLRRAPGHPQRCHAPLIEFDAYGGLGWEGFLTDPPVVREGRVWASEVPGMGARIAEGADERYRVEIGGMTTRPGG
jgi:hypothetical protein